LAAWPRQALTLPQAPANEDPFTTYQNVLAVIFPRDKRYFNKDLGVIEYTLSLLYSVSMK